MVCNLCPSTKHTYNSAYMLRQNIFIYLYVEFNSFYIEMYSPVHFLSLERNMSGRFSNLSQKNRCFIYFKKIMHT